VLASGRLPAGGECFGQNVRWSIGLGRYCSLLVCEQAYAVQTDDIGFDETPGRAARGRENDKGVLVPRSSLALQVSVMKEGWSRFTLKSVDSQCDISDLGMSKWPQYQQDTA
jgi:hypothetical protein